MDIIWIACTYVIGSIPFGLVIARVFCGTDPRLAGSGNIGSTNIARLCGKKWGAATLLCDVLKGALPVYAATRMNDSALLLSLTALAAILGHRHSCFLRFAGGKGVATTVGVWAALAFFPLLIAGGLCILVIRRSGFVSLGSLTLVSAMPLLLAGQRIALVPLALVIMGIVYWSHRDNIRRLARGEEKPWARKTAEP
jgi:glycerol-3-phosphate acyltransferase PlsY